MTSVFWKEHGILFIYYPGNGHTINSENHEKTVANAFSYGTVTGIMILIYASVVEEVTIPISR